MRIPNHHQRQTVLDNDSMTPMIDVVFLLLVFFVCASIGQRPESLLPAEIGPGTTKSDIDVPVVEPDEIPSQPVRIRLGLQPVSQALDIQLNERPVPNAAELTQRLQRLAELDAASPIILNIDDDLSIQQFIGIYDLCQALAFESISFAVKEAAANQNH